MKIYKHLFSRFFLFYYVCGMVAIPFATAEIPAEKKDSGEVSYISIDISRNSNMAFADETPDDQAGGWTDQGSNNDLRAMPSGKKIFGGVSFNILEPGDNEKKSCIVLKGPQRDYFPETANILFSGNEKLKNLFVLHASAWTPPAGIKIGIISLNYQDGTRQEFDVISGREVGNWWSPVSLKNGIVVWKNSNKLRSVGLYLSKFKLKGKAIKSILFTSTGKAVWMIAGISGTSDDVPEFSESPSFSITESKDWIPYKHSYDIRKGSILDFSFLLDPPAGKYGKVLIKNGHFEFKNRPGKRVKFYGNHAGLEGITKKECEVLAQRFAGMGYNAVRFHVYDQDLQGKKGKSISFDEKQLNILDYLFHCFKKEGIYITIDLYVARVVTAEEVPELGKQIQHEYKFLTHLCDSALNNWKQYAKNLLLHKNPYTGIIWKDDPALISISLINEDTPYHQMNMFPEVRSMYVKKYKKWLDSNLFIGSSVNFRKFLTETYIGSYRKMITFLREIGVEQALSGVNFMNHTYLTPIRNILDYVDNHCYFDHPLPVGGIPFLDSSLKYRNIANEEALAELPRIVMPTRIIGKPFILSEFNQVFPNRYRSSSGAVTAAYAGLQDWDGLFRLGYASNPYKMHEGVNVPNGYMGNVFSISNDPVNLFSDRIGILLFLRGEMLPGKTVIPYLMDADCVNTNRKLLDHYPEQFSELGLVTQISSLFINSMQEMQTMQDKYSVFVADSTFIPKSPGDTLLDLTGHSLFRQLKKRGIIQNELVDTVDGVYKSDTGQIFLNSKEAFFKVITAKSEFFTLFGKKTIKGKTVDVVNLQDNPCSFFISSMDQHSLQLSKKMLIIFLTDVQSSGIEYKTSFMELLTKHGKLPHLIRTGKVKVTIKNTKSKNIRIWALSSGGKRGQQIEIEKNKGDNIVFILDNTRNGNTCIAYEVERF